MVDEFRTKNVAYNTDYSWKIIYIAMKNVIMKIPLLNFVEGSWGPIFKL